VSEAFITFDSVSAGADAAQSTRPLARRIVTADVRRREREVDGAAGSLETDRDVSLSSPASRE